MFAYNPQVNDRSGEIYGAHQVEAAKAQAAGQMSLGKSIGDGLQSAGSSIAGGMTKAGENKMTSEYLDSLAGQYSQTPGIDGKTPLMSQDELDKFSKMSLGAKQGMIVPKQAQFDQILKNQYLAAQIQGFGQRQSMQNQVPANQQPYTPPAQQANPAGNINMNFVR